MTVWLVVPEDVILKSGVPTKEKLRTLFPPKAMGFGTGGVKKATPLVMGPAEPTMM